MCNERIVQNEFCLGENIRLKGDLGNFSVIVRDHLLLENCNNFSYIKDKLFVTKSKNNLYVFSTKVINVDGEETLEELAAVDIKSHNVLVKVTISELSYLIDSNCQITLGDRPRYY